MNTIDKKIFCELITALKAEYCLTESLNDVFRHYQYDTRIFSTNLLDAVVDMLEHVFDDKEAQWIQYWMFELNFGDSYKEGDVKRNGKNIPLNTAGDLYDFLMVVNEE